MDALGAGRRRGFEPARRSGGMDDQDSRILEGRAGLGGAKEPWLSIRLGRRRRGPRQDGQGEQRRCDRRR